MPIYKRKDVWWIRLQVDGKRVAQSAGRGATAGQAKALEAQIRQDIIRGRLGQTAYTLEDAAARWLEGEAKGLKDYKKLLSIIRIIRPFLVYEVQHGQLAAQAIMEAWPDLKAATINRRLAVIRRLCNLAWKWGWIEYPPKIELQSGEVSRHVYLTIPQVINIAKRCGRAKWHVILAAFSGMREGEIFSLTPDMIHNDLILLPTSKSGKPRAIPLNIVAQCAIARLDYTVTYAVLRREFERARGDADIRFHDLRHTTASLMVKGGASLVEVRDVLGHSGIGMTGRYSHLAFGSLRNAVDKMLNGTKLVQYQKRKVG